LGLDSELLFVGDAGAIFGTIRVRHFGPRPLVEDDSVQSQGSTLWNGEVGLQLSF
jgi:hypothetical protein